MTGLLARDSAALVAAVAAVDVATSVAVAFVAGVVTRDADTGVFVGIAVRLGIVLVHSFSCVRHQSSPGGVVE